MPNTLSIRNAQPVHLSEIPLLSYDVFRNEALQALRQECRIVAFAPLPSASEERQMLLVLLNPKTQRLELTSFLAKKTYPSLTVDAPAFHWFEREIFEQTGILPEGHPWLKPIRFEPGNSSTEHPEIGVTDYFTLKGDGAHEVAVGPVHAGVIEPGHFRFQCLGEDVLSLEIELGYQHRGIEKMLVGGPDGRSRHVVETAAGDTSIAQALCYHALLEAMSGYTLSPRARALRTLAFELERIANHIGDLGALAGDVAFLPTASYCGRIRGDFLNMTASLCGNRFGRGLITLGGVRYPVDDTLRRDLLSRLAMGKKELDNALELMFDEPTVLDRFENTGTVAEKASVEIGAVGMAARASGRPIDARKDLDSLSLTTPDFYVVTDKDGDVLSRALVRRKELEVSLTMVQTLLEELPGGATDGVNPRLDTAVTLPPQTLCIAVAEAWRGELCHLALTDEKGAFSMYKIIDPSFHNWFALALALRNQQIADFPICNKSFNLSYCGHDL